MLTKGALRLRVSCASVVALRHEISLCLKIMANAVVPDARRRVAVSQGDGVAHAIRAVAAEMKGHPNNLARV